MRVPAVLAAVALLTLAVGGYAYWQHDQSSRTRDGLATANGRIEVTRVDIASKLPGRVSEIAVYEGDSCRRAL
jgi:HlyD family secretion protein